MVPAVHGSKPVSRQLAQSMAKNCRPELPAHCSHLWQAAAWPRRAIDFRDVESDTVRIES